MPITKVETEGDTRRVFGLVTNDDIDSDDQMVDADFACKAMGEWFSTFSNVRQQHSVSLPPAGKGIRLEDTPKGQYVEALVVEPTAIKLVDAGVYSGFSVGISHPRIVRDSKARGGRINGGVICEISLVDRPANMAAKFALCKMAGDGSIEYIGKAVMLDEGTSELEPTPDPRRTVKRIREGAHVTIHARDEYGDLTAYEGIVTKRLRTAVALDCTRFSRTLGTVILMDEDITASYKGSYPIEVTKEYSGGPVVSDEVLTKLSMRIKNDSTGDIMAAMRRVSQWALAGTSAISDTDLERVYSAYAAEFSGRNPNKHVESFPATSIGKGRIANVSSLDELVDEVLKYNDNHDENGRFSSGGGGGKETQTSDLGLNHLPPEMSHPGGDKPGTIKPTQGWNEAQDRTDIYGTHSVPEASKPDVQTSDWGLNRLPPETKSDEPDTTKTTEANDSLADETTIATPDETKAACEKCKGTGMFEDAKCDKCSTKAVKAKKSSKPKVTKQVAEANAAAADAHAAAANATDDPKDAADHADAADEAAEAAEEAEETEAEEAQEEADAKDEGDKKAKKGAKFGSKKAPPFGKKPKADAADTEPDADDTAKVAKEVSYAIRKAHDWTCAAYGTDSLLETYPTVEDGKSALGEKVQKSLMKALRKTEDPHEIAVIGKALEAFADLTPEDLTSRDELTVAFKAENPDIGALPRPSDTITPGQFKRPFITAGHETQTASAHAPRIPTTTHPVDPEDFKRGPLTEGHQSASKMSAFHDALSSWNPTLCRMDSSGSNAFDRQPASSFQRPPFTNEVPNSEHASPVPVTGAQITAATKTVDLGLETAPATKTYTADELDAALSKAVKPLLTKINRMETEYEELAASPDPNRSAFRGAAGTGMNKITAPDAKKAAHKAARKAKKVEKIDYYRDLANSPDPSIRTHAQDFLAKVGKL